jgi:hypothetical protein
MGSNRITWSKNDTVAIIKILKRFRRDEKEAALVEIARYVGVNEVNDAQLRGCFGRFKLGNYTAYLGSNRTSDVPVRDTDPAPEPVFSSKDFNKPRASFGGQYDTENLDEHEARNTSMPPAPPVEEEREEQYVHPVEREDARRAERGERKERLQLIDELRNFRTRQAFLDARDNTDPPIMPSILRDKGKRELCAVVLASDWHVEEESLPVEPFDEYNLAIADKSQQKFFNGIVDLIQHHRASGKLNIEYLCLWLGGDFMTGYIHEDCKMTSQLSPTETMIWLIPRLEGGIRMLLKELNLVRIEIPCSFGNHGRTTLKPMIAVGAENSYEWLMYHMLADRFKDDERVHFEITKSAHQYVNIYGYTLHFHHGDHVNYAGGILGPGVPFMKAIDAWNYAKQSDITHIGHYHDYNVFKRGIMNGSLIGYTPFAMKVKARKAPPVQAFYLLDSKRSACHHTGIWVS